MILPPMLACAALLLVLPAAPLAMAAEPEWQAFDVVVGDYFGLGKERLAILLRATIDGVDCRVQLDTGAPDAVMWHHGGGAAQPGAQQARIRIGALERLVPAQDAQLAPLRKAGCGGVAATVGNAFFDHGSLHLDLQRERFAFTQGGALAHHPEAQALLYLAAPAEGGHPLVTVTLANGAQGHMLLDTGSMRFGLVATDDAQWRQMTSGLQAAPARELKFNNAIDANAIACQERPSHEPMTVGGRAVRQELVTYCAGKRLQLAQPLLGVLGLRPLARHRLTIDYVSRRWLLQDATRAAGE